ncbi:hypothetical protein R4Z09_12330 [Niallia oryzisoli]|uniref:Uncharacterized protein n=1 Tax=Niallia oryzisoli TaxID=1737571 RepID=A0ABZ2CMA5_9BACI
MQKGKNIYREEKQISISRIVVHGRKKGRELCFPMENLNIEDIQYTREFEDAVKKEWELSRKENWLICQFYNSLLMW